MDKFNNISNSKFWRSLLGNSSSKLSPIFVMSGYIMPLLFGFSVGWIGAIFIDYIISPRKAVFEEYNMVANMAATQSKVETVDGLAVFIDANPFSISPFSNSPLPPADVQYNKIIPTGPIGKKRAVDRIGSSEEMGRFRMRPKFVGNDLIGIEVQWIQNDSVLSKLGVQRGDILQSINGIPMKNMADITNAFISLMNANSFDVEVVRGDSTMNLLSDRVYVVR